MGWRKALAAGRRKREAFIVGAVDSGGSATFYGSPIGTAGAFPMGLTYVWEFARPGEMELDGVEVVI